jgi:hypothetical protein
MTPIEIFYLIMTVIPVIILTVGYIIDHRKKRPNSSSR